MFAHGSIGCLVAIGSLMLCGCTRGTYPVEGVVQFEDGNPAVELAGGFVNFHGIDRRVSAQGEIHGDATFELSTFERGDGALPGEYRVVVTPPPFAGSELQKVPQWIDPQFSNRRTSPLKLKVETKRNSVVVPVLRFKKTGSDARR